MSSLICAVNGCNNCQYTRRLCRKHYARLMRYGNTNLQRLPALERFLLNVDKNGPVWEGTHCWIWKGTTTPAGYGRIKIDGKGILTHRFTFEHYRGQIDSDKETDHLCRNRVCCNPWHLEPVTHSVNVKRGDIEAMSYQKLKTHCPKGHPYSLENTWVNRLGHRFCRKCHAERQLQRYHSL